MLVVEEVAGVLSESEGCKEVGLEVWLDVDWERGRRIGTGRCEGPV